MAEPLIGILMMTTATTGSWFSRLSDTKKGIVTILAALSVGFAVGTTTIAQVGLPERVANLEAFADAADHRITAVEGTSNIARTERDFIIDMLEWQSCAIMATSRDNDITTSCGTPPIRRAIR